MYNNYMEKPLEILITGFYTTILLYGTMLSIILSVNTSINHLTPWTLIKDLSWSNVWRPHWIMGLIFLYGCYIYYKNYDGINTMAHQEIIQHKDIDYTYSIIIILLNLFMGIDNFSHPLISPMALATMVILIIYKAKFKKLLLLFKSNENPQLNKTNPMIRSIILLRKMINFWG